MGIKNVSTELFEKEIKKLRKENDSLRQQLEITEKYRNEYKDIIAKLKQTQNEYEKRLKSFNKIEYEYRKQLEFLTDDSK